jgi:UDP-N-acetylmuramoyl-tripeptide--D-alanyl-D-alanine ligase
MGMNHIGEIAPLAAIAKPNAAIITNIGTAHIEHMGSRENIGLEKGRLVEALGPRGTAILNADDPFTPSLAARHSGATLTAGFAETADIRVTAAESTAAGSKFALTFPNKQTVEVLLALPGRHMIGNAALAAAAGWLRGLELEQIKQGLEAATLTKGRLQIRKVADTVFLDDSYNANPDSMLAGLRTLEEYQCEGRKIAVLGRMGELGIHAEAGHQTVGAAAASERIAMVCAVGNDDSRILANAAQEAGAIVRHFPDHASCAEFLKTLSLTSQDVIFVKGSRSATMEKVIEFYS